MSTISPKLPKITAKLPDRELTPADFEILEKGTITRVWYWCYNEGDFFWKHDRVEDGRIYGQCWYAGDSDDWDGILDYMYEYEGKAVRGSGAEPVHGARPKKQTLRGAAIG